MGTAIEWTDETWNPVTGCTKVSPGCDHCYAERVTERFHGPGSFADVKLHPERLDKPLHWRRPRKVFVNSMSDLFHDDVPVDFLAQVFAVMSIAKDHTFQVLTKRHARMRAVLRGPVSPIPGASMSFKFLVDVERMRMGYPVLPDSRRPDGTYAWPLPNVWLGVSVEDQKWADIRIPVLIDTPAAVRFLSCEPLLGPLELEFVRYFDSGCGGCSGILSPAHEPACGVEPGKHWGIDWVIVGGESGPGARPMHPDWARHLRDQCIAAGVPFLMKQWGEWAPGAPAGRASVLLRPDGSETVWAHRAEAAEMSRVGKKAAGRELDGRTWDEYPEQVGVIGR